MIELVAGPNIVVGQPIHVAFKSDHRVSGRLRLTAGKDALTFLLEREGKDPETSAGPRVRGKSGAMVLRDWGEHAVGVELVLRFEGAKCWLKVVDGLAPETSDEVAPEETADGSSADGT